MIASNKHRMPWLWSEAVDPAPTVTPLIPLPWLRPSDAPAPSLAEASKVGARLRVSEPPQRIHGPGGASPVGIDIWPRTLRAAAWRCFHKPIQALTPIERVCCRYALRGGLFLDRLEPIGLSPTAPDFLSRGEVPPGAWALYAFSTFEIWVELSLVPDPPALQRLLTNLVVALDVIREVVGDAGAEHRVPSTAALADLWTQVYASQKELTSAKRATGAVRWDTELSGVFGRRGPKRALRVVVSSRSLPAAGFRVFPEAEQPTLEVGLLPSAGPVEDPMFISDGGCVRPAPNRADLSIEDWLRTLAAGGYELATTHTYEVIAGQEMSSLRARATAQRWIWNLPCWRGRPAIFARQYRAEALRIGALVTDLAMGGAPGLRSYLPESLGGGTYSLYVAQFRCIGVPAYRDLPGQQCPPSTGLPCPGVAEAADALISGQLWEYIHAS